MTVDVTGESSRDLRLTDALESAAPGVVVVLAQSPIGAAGPVAEAIGQAGSDRFQEDRRP